MYIGPSIKPYQAVSCSRNYVLYVAKRVYRLERRLKVRSRGHISHLGARTLLVDPLYRMRRVPLLRRSMLLFTSSHRPQINRFSCLLISPRGPHSRGENLRAPTADALMKCSKTPGSVRSAMIPPGCRKMGRLEPRLPGTGQFRIIRAQTVLDSVSQDLIPIAATSES